MSRRWRVAFVVLCALIGTAVPVIPTLWISWHRAVAAQQGMLDHAAQRALANADTVYADAARALRTIAASDATPCSPEHVREMLQITEDTLSVVNIGFGTGDIVECNAWGPLKYHLPKAAIDFVNADGIGIVLNWRPPTFGLNRRMLILRLGTYSALVDQRRFYGGWDAPSDQAAMTVEAPDGRALVDIDGDGRAAPADALTSRRSSAHWVVTASEPRITFAEHLHDEGAILLPLAATIALLCGASVTLVLRRQLSPGAELEAAVNKGELVAYYQPIIELATGRCCGAEALARWPRRDGSMVLPDVFIPLAESAGLISRITDRMIAAVVNDLGDLLRRDPDLHVSVNLSAADISSERILPVLEGALEGSGILPRQIWLEATERGFIDIDGARKTLAELRRRGHATAIDDFGTGYSGLSYLQKLPVDMLKIDRSFIDVIGTEAPTHNVTPHIIAMSHELDVPVIAEGVETERQAAYLRLMGVRFAQGWLFSRALPADDFIAFCRSNRHLHGAADSRVGG
ncbi:EAL domain-containing protein [Ancylobacter terrae]|uniref:EAL domain-containing protein n=1 Tax=Ancylobacter sp. sgz301288 TaxID=3342077 RepID=UPI003859BCE0